MMNKRDVAVIALLCCGFAGATIGAPYNFDENLVPLELALADYPDRDGFRWAGAEGVIQSGTEYLTVSGLSPLSASKVFLLAHEPDTSITLNVAKFVWDESLRACTTDTNGFCSVDFRTHDDVGFRLEADPGTAWRLVLVTTPESAMDDVLGSPLYEADPADFADSSGVTDNTSSETGSQIGSNWLWTLVGMIVVLLVAVIWLVRSRRNSPAAGSLVLLALFIGGPVDTVNAQGLPGTDTRRILELPDEVRDDVRDFDDSGTSERLGRDAARVDAMRARVSGFAGHLDSFLSLYDAAEEYREASTSLHTCSEISNPPGAPRIPSFCRGNAGCSSCFAGARERFNEVRGTLEQLRVIYSCTKNMTDKAIALGDSGSNVHAVVSLAWQGQKRNIEASVVKLQEAYDNKYLSLMGRLQDSMFQISRCEAQFGQPDWYDRFGYVYFEFMSDKYKRSN